MPYYNDDNNGNSNKKIAIQHNEYSRQCGQLQMSGVANKRSE